MIRSGRCPVSESRFDARPLVPMSRARGRGQTGTHGSPSRGATPGRSAPQSSTAPSPSVGGRRRLVPTQRRRFLPTRRAVASGVGVSRAISAVVFAAADGCRICLRAGCRGLRVGADRPVPPGADTTAEISADTPGCGIRSRRVGRELRSCVRRRRMPVRADAGRGRMRQLPTTARGGRGCRR